jgi:PD-(D/E)XK endonuclease
MRTTDIGNISMIKCVAAFTEAGYIVSLPLGDGHLYDLVIDDGTRLYRVQCKTARLQAGGVIQIWARSNQVDGIHWAHEFELQAVLRRPELDRAQ